MNILIVTGGTGSTSLQTGLYSVLKNLDGITVKVLVNAYDNGKSTGDVRRVFSNKILGPSDVRKNHSLALKCKLSSLDVNVTNALLSILDNRFTIESKMAKKYCLSIIESSLGSFTEEQFSSYKKEILKQGIYRFFSETATEVLSYEDFALANIIYGGLASLHGNSLRKASTIMSDILGLQDNVILNDDKSLLLKATRQSGAIIESEEEIDIAGCDDPINDIFFVDPDTRMTSLPVLCDEAKNEILKSDIIILSCGTISTTLLPTYKSVGFKKALEDTKADIFMISNCTADFDYPHLRMDEIISSVLKDVLPLEKIKIIFDSKAALPLDKENISVKKVIDVDIMPEWKANIYDPYKLINSILIDHFEQYLHSDVLVLDYDDTINGRNKSFPLSTSFNKSFIEYAGANLYNASKSSFKLKTNLHKNFSNSIFVCTGSFVNMLKFNVSVKPLNVYSSGGNKLSSFILKSNNNGSVEEKYQTIIKPVKLVDKHLVLSKKEQSDIVEKIIQIGVPQNLIIWDDCKICITPVINEYRHVIRYAVSCILKEYRNKLHVNVAGRTTVEISFIESSKMVAINDIFSSYNINSITYVGDEIDGNDAAIKNASLSNPNIKFLHSKNPGTLALFLKTIIDTKN